jgi:hypothetical protein
MFVRSLNDVRNGIAHSLFPDKRKRNKAVWRGESIFSRTGRGLFYEDVIQVVDYFDKHFPVTSVRRTDSTIQARSKDASS